MMRRVWTLRVWTLWVLGWAVTTVASGQILRKPVPDKVVVLTFDDGVVSHAAYVAPLLEEYGFGATFFVTEFPDPPFADTSLYMTWEQMRMLNEMGFEVGNHTANHAHLTDISADDLVAELAYIEDTGVALGIPKPLTFAYPAYRTDPYAIDVLHRKGYIFARIGGDRAYDPERDHPYLVPSFTMLADNRDMIFDAFDQARGGKIVVLTIHGVPDTAHPWVTTPPELFEEYLAYLSENDFTVLALRDLAGYVDVARALSDLDAEF